MHASSRRSLVLETAELLRSSVVAPESVTGDFPGLPKGIGVPTATAAYPFDVLSSDSVLNKLTVLIVDLDSVVCECVRVLEYYAQATAFICVSPGQTTFSSISAGSVMATASSAEAPQASPTPPLLPSLASLLRLFLEKMCATIRAKRVQVELVLGDCGDSLRQMNELCLPDIREKCCHDGRRHRSADNHVEAAPTSGQASSPLSPLPSPALVELPSSLRGAEEAALWLGVYQAVVSFMWSDGADVLSLTSLYVTNVSGWRGAMCRLNNWDKNRKALTQQAFPILCSSDRRAFFASINTDALLSLWSAWCASEAAQLCGRCVSLPPRYFFGFGGADDLPARCRDGLVGALGGTPSNGVGSSSDEAVPLHFRHGPSVARWLGLRSSAYLPVLYALLAQLDATVAIAREMSGASGEVEESDVHPLVARAVALVNEYCGVLHVDLLSAWMEETEARGGVIGKEGAKRTDTCGSAPDLALALWAAQASLDEVSAGEVYPSSFQVVPVWVGVSWKNAGPPLLWCALSRFSDSIPATDQPPHTSSQLRTYSSATAPPHSHSKALRSFLCLVRCLLQPTALASPTAQSFLALSFLPLRWRLASALHSLFSERADGDPWEGASDTMGITTIVSSALSLSVPLTYALADPHIGVADVVAAAAAARREIDEGADAPASPPTEWFHACLTRAALDDVRQYVRPAAQLTAVAITALWRARVWTCGVCLCFFLLFLSYLEQESTKSVPQSSSSLRMVGESSLDEGDNIGSIVGSEKGSHDEQALGVCQGQVEAWWNAVSCFTVLHSLTTSISEVAKNSAAMAAGKEVPWNGLSGIFTGCLPDATYGAADRLAFVSFLRGRGLLLTRGEVRDEAVTHRPDVLETGTEAKEGEGAVAPPHATEHTSPALPTNVLIPLIKRLQCPYLMDEVMLLHRVLSAMAAADMPRLGKEE
ncbi:hypothetical protein LSCM1_00964 [Leishmania martiniquensis]|uniref:Uncharacterized protein n=1 Tax=Leishmania martiniquensis TaxID=1580590 RepID=A0A836GFW5_9TRYP|nr:hypothetical protein LSCM1_00964 [Leishmania martiniquensis]